MFSNRRRGRKYFLFYGGLFRAICKILYCCDLDGNFIIIIIIIFISDYQKDSNWRLLNTELCETTTKFNMKRVKCKRTQDAARHEATRDFSAVCNNQQLSLLLLIPCSFVP